ncbi:MAG: cold shock domain-containing protein [Methylococcales bacterium]|nr:cold shock domain-containing protein [Methylococcales bacterium]
MTKTENKGVLKTWKDDRGFGFIKPDDDSDDLFIHISALQGMTRRPYRGDVIFYQVEHGNDGKSKAVNARIEGVDSHSVEKNSDKKWLWISIVVLGLGAIAAAVYVSNI